MGIVKKLNSKRELTVNLFDKATFDERNFYFETDELLTMDHEFIVSRVGMTKTNIYKTYYLPETERSRILGRESFVQRKVLSTAYDNDSDNEENFDS